MVDKASNEPIRICLGGRAQVIQRSDLEMARKMLSLQDITIPPPHCQDVAKEYQRQAKQLDEATVLERKPLCGTCDLIACLKETQQATKTVDRSKFLGVDGEAHADLDRTVDDVRVGDTYQGLQQSYPINDAVDRQRHGHAAHSKHGYKCSLLGERSPHSYVKSQVRSTLSVWIKTHCTEHLTVNHTKQFCLLGGGMSKQSYDSLRISAERVWSVHFRDGKNVETWRFM